MNDKLTKIEENPYKSPLAVEADASSRSYPSATKAVLAGAWRGTRFGAKWMTLVLAIPFAILLVWSCGLLFNAASRHGCDADLVLSWMGMMCTPLLLTASFICCGAVGGAIGIGMCEGLKYWRSGRKAKTPTAP